MIRKFLTIVVPFLAPTIAYIIWAYFRQEREEAIAKGRRLPAWQDYPWTWLVTTGALLAAVALVLAGTILQDGDVGQEYRPARYEDGKLVPGEFLDKESEGEKGGKATE
jgi:hypothetical protein